MHEIINLFKKSVNRGQFIVKNASIPLFPDTPEKEKGKISKGRAYKGTYEPLFQKGSDSTMRDRG